MLHKGVIWGDGAHVDGGEMTENNGYDYFTPRKIGSTYMSLINEYLNRFLNI